MQTLLFHNPSAGRGDHALSALADTLREGGLSLRVCSGQGDALEDALKDAPDLVVVAGGDGTVGRIAARLPVRSKLAILPFGTANNLATALGRWASPGALAAGWRQARAARLDRGFVEGPRWKRERFLEAVGFGALARAVDHADKSGAEGLEAGREAFRTILSHAEPRRFEARLDGEPWEGESLFAEVMNIPLFGPRLRVSPEAEPGDGLLNLVILPPARREAMIDWLRAPEAAPPPTESRAARAVELRWRDGPVRLDDECRDVPLPEALHFGLEEAPLTVLVPPPEVAA